MTPRKASRNRPLAILYVRVSTAGQASEGAGLDAQRALLTVEAERRGWESRIIADEGLSGKDLRRPGLQEALELLDSGRADYLLALRLDRVSRSVADFASLLDRSVKRGWGIVLLSPGIDTSDPAGRFVSNVLSSASQYERELVSARTREGLAQRRSEGVRLGRPRTMPDAVVDRILKERAAGRSLRAIAEGLNQDKVATAQGGKQWHASTVKAATTHLS